MNTPKQTREESAQAPAPELIDCGRVSEQTRGSPSLPYYELGVPPYDRAFHPEAEDLA